MDSASIVAVTSRSFSNNKELVKKLKQRYKNVLLNESGHTLTGADLLSFLSSADKAIIGIENLSKENLSALPKLKVISKYGVGLNNIVQRYKLLTTKQVNINQQANSFAVAIPMLTKQVDMNNHTQEQARLNDKYLRARNHVEELKAFYYSLLSYCLVIPFLIYINWYTSWHFQWFWFPLFGWGIGLAIQAFKVFVNDGAFGRDWENRKMKEYDELKKELNQKIDN